VKTLLATALLALPFTCCVAIGQVHASDITDTIASSSSPEEAQGWTSPHSGAHPAVTGHRLSGNMAFSGIFTYQNTYGSSSHDLVGWGIMPELNLTRHLGIQGDFVSLYTRDVYPAISRLMIAAGPRYTMRPLWKSSPFFFAEAGETRMSYGASSTPRPSLGWNPTASAGVGFDLDLSPRFGIQVIPGEWTGEHFDYNGQWQHSYMARAGFVFNFGRGE
jgi:hypothetical protein